MDLLKQSKQFNSLWHTSSVPALEVSLLFAGGAVLGLLVGAVSAVVLPVAEQPLRNAAVVGVTYQVKWSLAITHSF